jgi:hypothetical protein
MESRRLTSRLQSSLGWLQLQAQADELEWFLRANLR